MMSVVKFGNKFGVLQLHLHYTFSLILIKVTVTRTRSYYILIDATMKKYCTSRSSLALETKLILVADGWALFYHLRWLDLSFNLITYGGSWSAKHLTDTRASSFT